MLVFIFCGFKLGGDFVRYSYACKLEFYIPHAKVVEDSIYSINYRGFKENLFNNFKVLGLNYWQVIPFTEFVDGVECEAEQVVVYCNEALEQLIIREFWENCCRHHKELEIDTFFYTLNGVLISLEIGGENDEILQDS